LYEKRGLYSTSLGGGVGLQDRWQDKDIIGGKIKTSTTDLFLAASENTRERDDNPALNKYTLQEVIGWGK
jgi:hypothetical protein